MNLDKIFSIGAALVAVAGITVVVTNPSSADVIRSMGSSFAESIRAAQGR